MPVVGVTPGVHTVGVLPVDWGARSPSTRKNAACPIHRSIDDGLVRRLKALACTAPLHDLDARKGRLDWVDAEPYQMAEIALQAIDQVTIAMDFDPGRGPAQVVRPACCRSSPPRRPTAARTSTNGSPGG